MSDKEQLRAGVIGCGRISRAHSRGYAQAERATLVAGADPSEGQRQKFHQLHPEVKLYADYREMLDAEKLDLVSVCTWPPFHAEMTITAAEREPKGILCEKPMAVNLGEADRMIAACDRHGVKLIIGHQRRYCKRSSQAKEALKSGEIGDLLDVRGMVPSDLLTGGTHAIDLVRYYLDDEPIQWVLGQVSRQVHGAWGLGMTRFGHQVEAGSISRFEFANGVRGIMETGEACRPGQYYYGYVRLEGTKGCIEAYGDRGPNDGPSGWRILRNGQGWQEYIIEDEVNAFGREIEELCRSIDEGVSTLVDAQIGRADLEVLMAIYESCRRRGKVELPLTVSGNPLEEMVMESRESAY